MRKLHSRADKNLILSKLEAWDLQSSPEAMITFRTRSNDSFDFMEAILNQSKTQLVIRFSGGENTVGILINFALKFTEVKQTEDE